MTMKVSKEAFEALMKRPHAEVRKETKERVVLYRDAWLELAQNLCRIQYCEDYKKWKYETFEEYVEKELGITSREARYWKAIYKKFVLDLGVDGERLKGIHWCKLRVLVPVVTQKNVREWLKKAESMYFSDLEEMVQSGREPSEAPEAHVLKGRDGKPIYVTEEERKTIHKAIEVAYKVSEGGNDRDGSLLEMICLDYLGDHPESRKEALASMLHRIEQVWHVKLVAIDKEDPNWKALFEKVRDVIRGSQVEV